MIYNVFGFRNEECIVEEYSVEGSTLSFLVEELEAEGFRVHVERVI